jgi:branched-chain amino acid transport system permease protein
VVTALVFGFIYALVAAGLALIWGVADIVNFAHGEYMLIAMYVTAFIAGAAGGGTPLLLVPVNAVLLFVLGYGTYRLASLYPDLFATLVSRVVSATKHG